MPDPQQQQPEVVIVGADGKEHVFPAGFDPKRAAAIVRSQTDPTARAVAVNADEEIAKVQATYWGNRTTPEGSAVGRFVRNAGAMVNPVAIGEGLYQTVRHPVDTTISLARAQYEQGKQAWERAKEGRLIEAAGHAGAAVVPILGPAAAAAGEQIASGDIAGGLGTGAGLVATALIPAAARGAGRVLQRAPSGMPAAAEAAAAKRIVDVMVPKIGANKVRFGRMAEQVAPALATDLAAEGAPWSRTGLHAQVAAKLTNAEEALDAAADARLAARTFETQPIIDSLLEKRRQLTAETVEADRPIPTRTGPGGRPVSSGLVRDVQTGQMKPALTPSGRPIGKDVVPAPNAARVAVIDQALAEIKTLGPVARYEPIRRIRQAYDGPAKAIYSPSITADFLKAQGGKMGAADVTGTLRDALAHWDPDTATANAGYALYRKANDVLEATQEIERTRPKVGRQIAARIFGTFAGERAAGIPGMIVGYAGAPLVDAAVSSGWTTQLKTAALLTKLAKAVRTGDLGLVTSVTSDLRRIGATSAAVIGNATNPSGFRTPEASGLPPAR